MAIDTLSPLRVKICGITRAQDAELACKLGADAIGFIFYPKSPRFIEPIAAALIAEKLPVHVARVGVFVAPTFEAIERTRAALQLDALQIHGHHDFENIARWRKATPVICAVNLSPDFELDQLGRYRKNCDALLLDGYQKGTFGGTGKTIDWQLAKHARTFGRIILAGGLQPDTIVGAVTTAQPYAVDVNSGIEDSPGLKNHAKIKALFNQLKDFRRDWYPAQENTFPMA